MSSSSGGRIIAQRRLFPGKEVSLNRKQKLFVCEDNEEINIPYYEWKRAQPVEKVGMSRVLKPEEQTFSTIIMLSTAPFQPGGLNFIVF